MSGLKRELLSHGRQRLSTPAALKIGTPQYVWGRHMSRVYLRMD